MHRPPPPKPVIMLALAALAVELPFFITFLLVEGLKQCPHCRHEWLSWPILAGAFPWYVSAFIFHIIPRDVSLLQIKCGWAAFTACFVGLLFAACRRCGLWRWLLAGGIVAASGLALLAFLLIAA